MYPISMSVPIIFRNMFQVYKMCVKTCNYFKKEYFLGKKQSSSGFQK